MKPKSSFASNPKFLKKIKGALPGLLIAGASLGGLEYEKHNYNVAKNDLRAAQTESIDLRCVADLNPEQKRKLFELQDITIPELKDKAKNSEPSTWPTRIGVTLGLLLVMFSNGKENGKNGKNGKLFSHIDSLIEEACERASPQLDLSGLSRKSEMTR